VQLVVGGEKPLITVPLKIHTREEHLKIKELGSNGAIVETARVRNFSRVSIWHPGEKLCRMNG